MSPNMEGDDAVPLLSQVPLVARVESGLSHRQPRRLYPAVFWGGDTTDDQPNI
jgi:hypothetical protein